MAKAIVTGIEKDRLVITADVQTAALARAGGLLGPYVRHTMDRQVQKVRHERSPCTRGASVPCQRRICDALWEVRDP